MFKTKTGSVGKKNLCFVLCMPIFDRLELEMNEVRYASTHAKCPDSVQIPEDGVLAPHSSSSTPLRISSGQVKKVILRLLQAHPESLTGGTKSQELSNISNRKSFLDEERELKGFCCLLTDVLECFKKQ